MAVVLWVVGGRHKCHRADNIEFDASPHIYSIQYSVRIRESGNARRPYADDQLVFSCVRKAIYLTFENILCKFNMPVLFDIFTREWK